MTQELLKFLNDLMDINNDRFSWYVLITLMRLFKLWQGFEVQDRCMPLHNQVVRDELDGSYTMLSLL